MKLPIPFFFLFCIAAACQQNPSSSSPDSSNTKDSATVSQTPKNDSIIDSSQTNTAACTFTWQELAEMEQRWLNSRLDKFLPEKEFRPVSSLPFSNGRMAAYEKTGSSELLEISDVAYDEGDNTVEINYYIPSEAGYKAFTGTLQTSTFKYNKRKNRYETFISTYEESYFVLHGQVVKNKKAYYRVQYYHTTGKELSIPKLPANDAVQK